MLNFRSHMVEKMKLPNIYRQKGSFDNTEKQLALAERFFVVHTINHNQSFRSMDCTFQMMKTLDDKKFACARTKTEAIICNVFSPQLNIEVL